MNPLPYFSDYIGSMEAVDKDRQVDGALAR